MLVRISTSSAPHPSASPKKSLSAKVTLKHHALAPQLRGDDEDKD